MFRVSRRFATSATTTTTARGAVAGGGNIATTTTTGKPVTTKTARILVPKTTGEGRVSAAQLKAVRASLQQHGTLTGAPSPLPEPPALAPGALKAAQHQQHLIASGISAHGTGARLLVLQRGARPRGQNALTASHLRRLDALIQRFATDTLAHSIVIQSASASLLFFFDIFFFLLFSHHHRQATNPLVFPSAPTRACCWRRRAGPRARRGRRCGAWRRTTRSRLRAIAR